ncbi:hypothetical protein HOY80DRAFT_746729 [Tuber brumale]|nr:hypothetical protein HOY80DRAFT_746729 [Tuber brumale]
MVLSHGAAVHGDLLVSVSCHGFINAGKVAADWRRNLPSLPPGLCITGICRGGMVDPWYLSPGSGSRLERGEEERKKPPPCPTCLTAYNLSTPPTTSCLPTCSPPGFLNPAPRHRLPSSPSRPLFVESRPLSFAPAVWFCPRFEGGLVINPSPSPPPPLLLPSPSISPFWYKISITPLGFFFVLLKPFGCLFGQLPRIFLCLPITQQSPLPRTKLLSPLSPIKSNNLPTVNL